jgi:hypothetical protein
VVAATEVAETVVMVVKEAVAEEVKEALAAVMVVVTAAAQHRTTCASSTREAPWHSVVHHRVSRHRAPPRSEQWPR